MNLKAKIDEARKLKEEAESLYKEQENNLQINLKKIEQLKIDTNNEIKKISKSFNEELQLIISRKQNTFDNNSKQAEEKIKDELKKEILSKTIFFTEHRIKKEIKKNHNSKFIEESLKKLSKNIS